MLNCTQMAENFEMNVRLNDTDVFQNFTEPEDPTLIFGPKRDPLYIVIPITIVYSLIFVTGLFGNIFTCMVIIRNKSMHTATNYYLFSLAISDLLLLVCGMPQEMYFIWSKWPYVFGQTFCVIRGLAAETSTNASVLTITLFTIERYLAICHPFVSHKMSKLSRAIKHIILLWIASFGLALPQALQFGLRNYKGVIMCHQTRVIIKHAFEISTFFFFFAPMVLISVLYFLIGMRLRQSSITREAKERDELGRHMRFTHKIRRRNSHSTKRVVKMLVAVVVAFFICWAPFHAQRLVAIYGPAQESGYSDLLFVYVIVTYISGVFYYLSTCINPIFYHIMSNKFREAFKNSMMQCCRGSQRRLIQRSSYTAVAITRAPYTCAAITRNSGNSVRTTGSRTSKLTRLDSDDQTNGNNCNASGNRARYYNANMPTGELDHYSNSPDASRDSDTKTNSHDESLPKRGAHRLPEFTAVTEKKKKCSSCCGSRESSSDIIIPNPDAVGSSSENKTESYPYNTEKLLNNIQMNTFKFSSVRERNTEKDFLKV